METVTVRGKVMEQVLAQVWEKGRSQEGTVSSSHCRKCKWSQIHSRLVQRNHYHHTGHTVLHRGHLGQSLMPRWWSSSARLC